MKISKSILLAALMMGTQLASAAIEADCAKNNPSDRNVNPAKTVEKVASLTGQGQAPTAQKTVTDSSNSAH